MALLEKFSLVAKAAFGSSDGSALTLGYTKEKNTPAGPLLDLTGYLSAMPPLPASGPVDYQMRQRDFRIAENIDYIPGGGKFNILRSFADRWNVLRSIIDTKKSLMSAVPWDIKPVPNPGETKSEASVRSAKDPVVNQLKEFFACPDGFHNWFQWLTMFLEEVYVLDAGCIQVVRDSKGRIASLPIISGDTINRVIDDRGWTPSGTQVAYQQVLSGSGTGPEGIPQRNYTTRDLLYCMRNPRAAFKWGQSSVEKIYQYCLTGILADEFIKDYYTSGNQPPGFLILGGMTPTQVEEYDKKFNAVYQSNLAARRRIAMVSGGVGDKSTVQYVPTKQELLKTDIYDEMIRFAAYEFSVSVTALMKPMNRASADNNQEQAEEEGLMPDLEWLAPIMNKIIQDPLYFNLPGYMFTFGPRRDVDPVKQMQVDTGYAAHAILTVDEIREELGKEPFKGIQEASQPGVMTPNNGFIPLSTDAATKILTARQKTNSPAAAPAAPKPPAGTQKYAGATISTTTTMPPKEFLEKLGDTAESVQLTNEDVNKVQAVRHAMREGKDIPPSSLDLDAAGHINGHDGRHRALAALLEGREQISVIITQPTPVEKVAADPAKLAPESKIARGAIEARMSTVLAKLRAKTLREIAAEKIVRGKNGK